jgi:hypothetical protein
VAEVEGRSFAFELSLAHGLGLVGVGAPAAIRALVPAATQLIEVIRAAGVCVHAHRMSHHRRQLDGVRAADSRCVVRKFEGWAS